VVKIDFRIHFQLQCSDALHWAIECDGYKMPHI